MHGFLSTEYCLQSSDVWAGELKHPVRPLEGLPQDIPVGSRQGTGFLADLGSQVVSFCLGGVPSMAVHLVLGHYGTVESNHLSLAVKLSGITASPVNFTVLADTISSLQELMSSVYQNVVLSLGFRSDRICIHFNL